MVKQTFNAKCPTCGGPIHVVYVSAHCSLPIRDNGWAVMVTQKNSSGSETYACPRCEVTVPCDWVYKEMSEKEAQRLMKQWGANPLSIHNQKKDAGSQEAVANA